MNDGRPLLIYDGKCSFCGIWVRYFQRCTGPAIDYVSSQEVGPQYPEISPEEFKRSIYFIRSDHTHAKGARAAFELMAQMPGKAWLLWSYRNIPGFIAASEAAYRFIAGHRSFFFWLTRFFWGKEIYPAAYRQTRSVILKGLAIVYLIAFLSLIPQLSGLIGAHGILPTGEYLDTIRTQTGLERYWLLPTLAWMNSSDMFLQALCWTGCGLAIALFMDIASLTSLFGMFVLYLSIVSIGQDFLSFQWDILLLEAGFAGMLLAHRALLPRNARSPGVIGIWVIRFLVFRLMLESGLVKLLSGDPSWRSLTAMSFHYETQPLPTPLGWYAHQLPASFHKFSNGGVFAVEIFAPFLFLMPRRLRIVGAWITIVFQSLIAATGNYTFFNLLTIILCVSLFDDRHLQIFIPATFRPASAPELPAKNYPALLAGALLILIGFLKLAAMTGALNGVIAPFSALMEPAETLHVVNNYGLFAVMTTSRPEIIVEGSEDGKVWQAYEFKYKAGDVHQPPHWVAPYQPRLDWQMWFAALGGYRQTPWFHLFMQRLLEGSPDVLSLLAKNPFPDKPPRFLRATGYEYKFTTMEERRITGDWWTRTYMGLYFPEVRLK